MGQAKKGKRALPGRLTLNEINFCHNYFGGKTQGNAVRSYLAAGFVSASDSAAAVAASNLLKATYIQAYLTKLARDACAAAEVTTEMLVRGFAWACEAQVSDLFDDQGNLLPKKDWPDALKYAVQSIKAKRVYETIVDPTDSSKTIRVQVGVEWDIKMENKTENRKVLAQMRKLIGPDAEAPAQEHKPLVVKNVDPDKL